MKIGELSRRTGVSVRMLRYYEQEALLQPNRRESGYREYGDEEEKLVRCIRLLKESGLTLGIIKKLMPCILIDRPEFQPCPMVLATLRREINEIDKRMVILRSSRRILSAYLGEIT